MKIVCEKCKITRDNSQSPLCPICVFGKPSTNAIDKIPTGGYPQRKKEKRVGQGIGGGRKREVRTCKQCGYNGFAIPNPHGNSANCFRCNHRIY